MMKFLVKQQKIEALEREVIASDQIAFVSVKFVFDGAWKTLHKVVQFTQCEETYNLVLGIEGTTCLLPSELHPGAVKMSLFGYDAESDTTLRATTVPRHTSHSTVRFCRRWGYANSADSGFIYAAFEKNWTKRLLDFKMEKMDFLQK